MTTPLYTLYFRSGMASMAPHMVLEATGVPFRLVRVDTEAGEHRGEVYRRMNPTGKVPVMLDHALGGEAGVPVFETAAIMLHLADRHPEAGLMPPPGSLERAQAYQWLIHLTNTVQPAMIDFFYPDRVVGEAKDAGAVAEAGVGAGGAPLAPLVQRVAAERLMEMFRLLDRAVAERASAGHDWLAGDRLGLADIFLFMMVRWGRNFDGVKPRELTHLGALAARVAAWEPARRAFTTEELAAPLY